MRGGARFRACAFFREVAKRGRIFCGGAGRAAPASGSRQPSFVPPRRPTLRRRAVVSHLSSPTCVVLAFSCGARLFAASCAASSALRRPRRASSPSCPLRRAPPRRSPTRSRRGNSTVRASEYFLLNFSATIDPSPDPSSTRPQGRWQTAKVRSRDRFLRSSLLKPRSDRNDSSHVAT
ncbi:MAG: hypothetical protein QOG00_2340 [Pyrinomonadaceae bacterium]|nr:hypothetical protein [Pyrinomonadaceae bacterium]